MIGGWVREVQFSHLWQEAICAPKILITYQDEIVSFITLFSCAYSIINCEFCNKYDGMPHFCEHC
jgi:hypothetical protein